MGNEGPQHGGVDETDRLLAAHRQACAGLGIPADEPAVRALLAWYRPPAWASGFIAHGDAIFLFDVLRRARPPYAIELGVASGASTAFLLHAMRTIGLLDRLPPGQPGVRSFDLSPTCYFDPRRPVGDAVREMAPELLARLQLQVGVDARGVAAACASAPAEFLFLDADHRHPMPIADMLRLAPALAPGAWVVLHDIDLPRIAREHATRTGEPADWGHSGPQRLFAAWPFEKLAGAGAAANCGAIRMPARGQLRRSLFAAALAAPWEVRPDWRTRRLLGGWW